MHQIKVKPLETKETQTIEIVDSIKPYLIFADIIECQSLSPRDMMAEMCNQLPSLVPYKISDIADILLKDDVNEKKVIFVNALIQKSYNAGNTHFNFDIADVKFANFLWYLDGNMHITINGNISSVTSKSCRGITLLIDGDVGNGLGIDSYDSKYTIIGSVGNLVGYGAKNSSFEILGDIGDKLGVGSSGSTFDVYRVGNALCSASDGAIVRIHNLDSYIDYNKDIQSSCYPNMTVQFVQSGKVLDEIRYGFK